MTPSRVQPFRRFLPLGSLGTFEDRPGADDACGEAWLDALFDRTHAIDHESALSSHAEFECRRPR